MTRLKSKSAVSCTRARPGPTTEVTIDLDLLAQPPLERDLALVGGHARRIVAARAVRQEPAGLVDDRHALGLQAVDGGGDEMADRAHLLRLEHAAHPQHDRGRRLRPVAREQLPLRQHQVHARRLHPVERPDGARELAFERAQVIDVLDEARGAERVGAVEDLVADAAALGQAAFRELHAQPRHPVARHHDHGAFVAQLERDVLALQVLDDGAGVLDRQVGEQHRHLRRRHAHDQEGEEADQRRP